MRTARARKASAARRPIPANVRFEAAILWTGLRFEERLGLMGGEDNEFFARAHAMGFEIRRTLRAVTHEASHPSRLTYRGQIYRTYWCAASEMRRLAITRGLAGACLRKAHTIPFNLAFGALWLLAAAFVAPVCREAFRDGALEGGRRLAKAAGRLAALLGHLPQPYLVVEGC
jgi:succinoglycan biosynthesis protein ExoM